MALPTNPASSWMQSLDFPSELFELGGNDCELYEEDDEFVLSVEMPGFDPEEITVSWEDGVLNIAAEHAEEHRGQRRTYHQRFRFPKNIDEETITAEYTNGILEVYLPVATDAVAFLDERASSGTPFLAKHFERAATDIRERVDEESPE